MKLDYSLEGPLLEGQLALVKAEVSLISCLIPVPGANRCFHEHAFHDKLAQQGPLTSVLWSQENHLLCQSWHHTGCLPHRGPELPDLVTGLLVHLTGPDRQPDDGELPECSLPPAEFLAEGSNLRLHCLLGLLLLLLL